MIIKGSYFNVIDNTGAKLVQCIQVLKKKQTSQLRIGDIIVVVIKKMAIFSEKLKVEKREVVYGVIVRTKQTVVRSSGIVLRNDINGLILLNKKCEPIGSRVIGVIYAEVSKIHCVKTMVISKHVI